MAITGSSSSSGAAQLNSLLSGKTETAKKNEQLGKDEFLQLLITQLKNQDPEAPVDSKEFAVQLAQFTQVEKLISIDDKLGAQAKEAGSMAGYLGQQVVLDSSDVTVKGGQGGQLSLDVPQDAGDLKVQLTDKNGEVVGEKSFGPVGAGKHLLNLDGLSLPDGSYGVKINAVSSSGAGSFPVSTAVSGIVTGFIPGADPKLIVNGQEVSVSSVREVRLPPASSAT